MYNKINIRTFVTKNATKDIKRKQKINIFNVGSEHQ